MLEREKRSHGHLLRRPGNMTPVISTTSLRDSVAGWVRKKNEVQSPSACCSSSSVASFVVVLQPLCGVSCAGVDAYLLREG